MGVDPRTMFRDGNLEGPLVIVAAGPGELLVVQKGKENDPSAEAQMFQLDRGQMLEEIKPLAIWFKFLYYVDDIDPPILLTEHEKRFRYEAYHAAKRAREAANG